MRILDLYCGAGGASMGYSLAGFEVVGVDLEPQPRYPFEFVQGDAIAFLEAGGAQGFDAIHASPPCQSYSSITPATHAHPDLYAPTRAALNATGLPWVIENVIGAPYSHGIVLCGSHFDLTADGEWLRRHRNFEASWYMWALECRHPDTRPINVTGHSYTSGVREFAHSRQGPFELACRLMGISWMQRLELSQAIPPAYTRYMGERLLELLERVA